jgi:hypothetical protein
VDQIEEILRDDIEILERVIGAAERGNQMAGLDLVDEDGKLVEHIDFYTDVTPYQNRLSIQRKRLDTYLESLV